MRPWLILLVLLAACTRPWSLDDRPCPCATGYRCCAATGLCLAAGQTCASVGIDAAVDASITADASVDASITADASVDASITADAAVDASITADASVDASITADAAGAEAGPDLTITSDARPTPEVAAGPWTVLRAVPDLVGRSGHTAVWTGDEMVVWGGINSRGVLASGARFNPTTGVWRPTTLDGAPDARRNHTAVWTGREMIVWGGDLGDERDYPVDGGGRYDPVADRWTPLPHHPDHQRTLHSAVWTGEEMIIWGGKPAGDPDQAWPGARHHPTRGWSPLSRTNAPSELTYAHSAVWGGGKMIVFGGFGVKRVSYVGGPGALYDPTTDVWTAMSSEGAPGGRGHHTAVWTGKEMLVWGGLFISGRLPPVVRDDGGRFDPATNRWTAMSSAGAGGPRHLHTAVWGVGPAPLPGRLIVWGGLAERLGDARASMGGGAAYDPQADRWIALPTGGAPPARCQHAAVWTGRQMLLWGGADINAMDLVYRGDGGRFSSLAP